MKVRKGLKYLAAMVMAALICLCTMVIMDGYHMYQDGGSGKPEEKVASIRSKENYTTFDELPEIYVDAEVVREDHRFYNHPVLI